MKRYRKPGLLVFLCLLFIGLAGGAGALAAEKPVDDAKAFPRSLDSYNDAEVDSIFAILLTVKFVAGALGRWPRKGPYVQ